MSEDVNKGSLRNEVISSLVLTDFYVKSEVDKN